MRYIFPSLLSVDFLNLKQEIQLLEKAGVDGLHLDVMDGQFVPNISTGLLISDAVRSTTQLSIDVHLMIENPENYIETLVKHGVDMISVHTESTPHIYRAIQLIKSLDKKAGVAINPGIPVDRAVPVLSMVDYVLVMTVNPGSGGQIFIDMCASKIKLLNDLKPSFNSNFDIEVDGGINDKTIDICVKHGANLSVTGSYFFNQDDYKIVTKILRG